MKWLTLAWIAAALLASAQAWAVPSDHPTVLPPVKAAPTWPPAGFSPPAKAMLGGLPVFPTCPTFTWQEMSYNVYLSKVSPTDPGTLAGSVPIQPSAAPVYSWTCTTPLADGTYYLTLTMVDARGVEGQHNVGVGFIVGSPSPPPVIGIGSTVFVSTPVGVELNVRPTAGGACAAACPTQKRGATGTVIGGPTVLTGVTWWQITYATGPSGWSSQGPTATPYLSLTAP